MARHRRHPRHPHEIPRPTLSPDTTPEAEAVQLRIFREMPPWEKAKLIEDAIQTSYPGFLTTNKEGLLLFWYKCL